MFMGAQGYTIKNVIYQDIKVQFVWREMDEICVQETPDTNISDISS